MKLILKTTTGRTTDAEFASGTTIRQVKESLQDEYDLASLRLCFQGKILADDSTIDTLTEGAALFIAGKKASIKKPETIAPASAPTASTTSTSSTATTTTTTNASATASTAEPTTTTATATNPEATTTNATTSTTNTTTTTPETTQDAAASAAPVPAPTPAPAPAAPLVDQELVDGICAMGFDDRPLVELALRAAYMNPDRAVDYLCSGTPRSTLQRLADDASPAIARPVPAPTAVPRQATAAPAPSNTALQAALASIPNFDQIKEVVRQNPASLPTFMQQLQQNHPEVFALVQENPQAFLDLLQSNASPAAEGVSTPTTVELTAQDQIAIQELAEIGGGQWDLQAAAIVYIAVNKNKEVAAAVLFEHGGLPPQLMQALLDRQAGGSGGDDDFEDDGDFEDN